MLKINSKITELLSEIEVAENENFLEGDLMDLRNDLLKLYCVTDNQNSREKIIAIMSEAGYPWFLRGEGSPAVSTVFKEHQKVDAEELFMPEEDFLNLLPANSHFH